MPPGLANLPQEVISLIASYLQRWEDGETDVRSQRGQAMLPPFATISRTWQYSIERRTFHDIHLKSSDLPDFSRIMIKHRQNILRSLVFDVILPAYSDKACAKFETKSDKKANNQAFTKAIQDLFSLLRSWSDANETKSTDDVVSSESSLTLCFNDFYSVMDWTYRERAKYKAIYDEFDLKIRRNDLFENRYIASVLQLESTQDLPEVPQVSKFSKCWANRIVEPWSVAMIASKFPNAKSIDWELWDNEKKDPLLRQQARYDFASALSALPQHSLRQVSLNYHNTTPYNQHRAPPSALLPSPPKIDHLSLALHKLSLCPNIIQFILGGNIVISPVLLWNDTKGEQPLWPNLVSFYLQYSLVTADGEWHLAPGEIEDQEEDDERDYHEFGWSPGAPESDDTGSDESDNSDIPDTFNENKEARAIGDLPVRCFRNKADTTKLHPLFAAAARAASQMPRLQTMCLKMDTELIGDFLFEMNYYAPGQYTYRGAGSKDIEMPRLIWEVGPIGYLPEESTLEVWRQAKGLGGTLVSSVLEWDD